MRIHVHVYVHTGGRCTARAAASGSKHVHTCIRTYVSTYRWAVQCEGSGERLKARSANVQLKPTWPPGAPVEREGGYAEEYVWVQTDKA